MTEHPPYRVASFYASSSALFLRVESRAGFVEIRYVKRAEEGLRVFECVSPLLRRFLTARSADAGPIFSPGDRFHFLPRGQVPFSPQGTGPIFPLSFSPQKTRLQFPALCDGPGILVIGATGPSLKETGSARP
jgi:hypothetical protein